MKELPGFPSDGDGLVSYSNLLDAALVPPDDSRIRRMMRKPETGKAKLSYDQVQIILLIPV